MDESRKPNSPRRAGGVFIGLGAALGALAGIVLGEPSAGLLIGFGAGSLAAVGLWWRDRGS